jgi:hypothetical protein
LQTYNKINGAIWRHFGKQMNKETKLRIHNITAKAALKFGSEFWVISGVWRHFGKQINKETKLRIHNITAKAALKFGSEFWVISGVWRHR